MTLEILFVAAGLLLVLAGIFGGGFEVQQIRVPVLGTKVRLIACGVGALLLLMAIGIHAESSNQVKGIVTSEYDRPNTRGSPSVRFVIFDTLSPDQVASGQAEQASISIDGTPNGRLTVNKDFPSADLGVVVSNEGQHSFAIEASAVYLQGEQLMEVSCVGTGMIDVTEGSRFLFEARVDQAGNCSAWLAKQ
jgi:hypothetical protein